VQRDGSCSLVRAPEWGVMVVDNNLICAVIDDLDECAAPGRKVRAAAPRRARADLLACSHARRS
jgi:hypothetical protein